MAPKAGRSSWAHPCLGCRPPRFARQAATSAPGLDPRSARVRAATPPTCSTRDRTTSSRPRSRTTHATARGFSCAPSPAADVGESCRRCRQSRSRRGCGRSCPRRSQQGTDGHEAAGPVRTAPIGAAPAAPPCARHSAYTSAPTQLSASAASLPMTTCSAGARTQSRLAARRNEKSMVAKRGSLGIDGGPPRRAACAC